MSRAGTGARRRVLLVGLDSADADLIDQWTDEGFLPTFASLRREGIYARLRTTAEIMHVSAWPTIYTGTTPGQHGLYHAYQIRAGEQLIHRTEPSSAGQPPFWKFLDEAGRRCIVFDAFMDYRLPGYSGLQILDYGTWTWFGEPGSSPQGLLREVRRRFGAYPAPEHSNFVQVPDDIAGFTAQLVAGTKVKSRIVQALMREHDWDFLFVTFGEPHGAGHYLWHVGDTTYPIHAADSGSHPVREVYAAIDAAISTILEAADEQTTVIVTSGDGMGPNYSGCHLMPELLHRMGHYFAAGVGGGESKALVPKQGLLAKLRQVVPLGIRQSVTRCLPRSVRYRMSMKWVNSGIDWARTRLFCIPNSNEGYFRVNLRGREPLGIVQPGAECDDLVAALTAELRGLRHPGSSLPAAERVTRIDEVFPGPRRGDLPDAVISWNPAARVTDALEAPGFGLVRGKAGHAVSPFYTGNHRAAAFVLARGPGVSGGEPAGAHIADIAPTVLCMLGVDVPRHLEGRPWPWRG